MHFEQELLEEFATAICKPSPQPPLDTKAIVVLDWFDHESTESMAVRARNPENLARVKYGADTWNVIFGLREHDRGLSEDYYAPYFCPNGLTPTISYFRGMSLEAGIPDEQYIRLLDNGEIGVGNSKTQFQVIVADRVLGNAAHITIVSSSYHVPRLERLAAQWLPKAMRYSILGVPFERFPFNVAKMVKAEMDRILAYSEKGDIAKYPRKQ